MGIFRRLLGRGSDGAGEAIAPGTYRNTEYHLELSLPPDWTISSENRTDQLPWVQPVQLVRQAPAKQGVIPCITVLLNVTEDDGSPLDAYMDKAESDLAAAFSNFEPVSRHEARVLGWPSAWLAYSYESERGKVEELNVTTFVGTPQQFALQFICEAPSRESERLEATFREVIDSAKPLGGWLRHPIVSLAGAELCSGCGGRLRDEPIHAMMSVRSGRLSAVCDDCRRQSLQGI